MRIGIIAAMKEEMNLILERMDNVIEESIIGYVFYSGKINDNDIIICESGVGKVNAGCAAAALISNYDVELIINTGIAGGLGDTKTRDVILANGLSWHDFDIRLFGYDYGQVPHMPKVYPVNPTMVMNVKSILNKLKIDYKEGIIISGDQFISDLSKLDMVKDLNAIACEMEGCAIAQVATKAGVDFIVLRYISDLIGAENQNDDYLKFENDMSIMSSKICIKLIENL